MYGLFWYIEILIFLGVYGEPKNVGIWNFYHLLHPQIKKKQELYENLLRLKKLGCSSIALCLFYMYDDLGSGIRLQSSSEF